jgi:hypothetical protein
VPFQLLSDILERIQQAIFHAQPGEGDEEESFEEMLMPGNDSE